MLPAAGGAAFCAFRASLVGSGLDHSRAASSRAPAEFCEEPPSTPARPWACPSHSLSRGDSSAMGGVLCLPRKKTASIVPTLAVSPSHLAYERAVSVKKNRRAVSPETCQPGISIVCQGSSTHLAAARSPVRLASTTLRPSTEIATAILSKVGFVTLNVKEWPRKAST